MMRNPYVKFIVVAGIFGLIILALSRMVTSLQNEERRSTEEMVQKVHR